MFSASLQKKIKNDISRSKNDFLEKIIKRKLNYHVKNKLSIKKKKKKNSHLMVKVEFANSKLVNKTN
jgi:hypothetical protein